MVSFIDQEFCPVIIDDSLLLAMYELELSAETSQDHPPRLPRCAVIDNVPRPFHNYGPKDGNCWACEEALVRAGPLRVYSRSPPARC